MPDEESAPKSEEISGWVDLIRARTKPIFSSEKPWAQSMMRKNRELSKKNTNASSKPTCAEIIRRSACLVKSYASSKYP